MGRHGSPRLVGRVLYCGAGFPDHLDICSDCGGGCHITATNTYEFPPPRAYMADAYTTQATSLPATSRCTCTHSTKPTFLPTPLTTQHRSSPPQRLWRRCGCPLQARGTQVPSEGGALKIFPQRWRLDGGKSSGTLVRCFRAGATSPVYSTIHGSLRAHTSHSGSLIRWLLQSTSDLNYQMKLLAISTNLMHLYLSGPLY